MSDTLSIYQSLARLMFPEGLLDYFTVVGVEEKDIPLSEQQGVETGVFPATSAGTNRTINSPAHAVLDVCA